MIKYLEGVNIRMIMNGKMLCMGGDSKNNLIALLYNLGIRGDKSKTRKSS